MAESRPSVASVSEPLSRLYDLALRTLDDQERRADAIRGRLGPVLAAVALGVSLLSGPLVGGTPPTTVAGKLTLVISVGGLAAALFAAARILTARGETPAHQDVQALVDQLTGDGALVDVATFYSTMLSRLGGHTAHHVALLDRLHSHFTAMLCGILVMLCGLALAAIVG